MRKTVLSIIILLIFLSMGVASAANPVSQDIYVSVSGNDSSSTGANPSSPYATIAKGVSDVNDSCNTTIHLSEGTFTGEGNIGVVINKAHRSQGGSLTIIGAGYNKTFIDGDSANRMFDVKADSIVKFVNITFINGKEANGGTIINTGDLTISNCIFENSYATSNGGVIYSTSGSLNISDSIFNNNSAGSASSTTARGGAIYATSTSTSISNSNFTNNHAARSGAVSLNNATITNSYFANNYATNNYGGSISISGSLINNTIINSTVNGTSGRGGAVYLSSGISYLKNNTMTDCSAVNGEFIYLDGGVNANITFVDLTVTTPKATVTATVTDDRGHIIHGGSLSFYADDILLGSANVVNGTATLTYTKLLENNGSYNLTGGYGSFSNLSKIINGNLMVNINRAPVYLYVSPGGNDETGNGTQSNPYLTILKAVNEGFDTSYYPTIYILEGTYSGANNTNISITDIGVLSLIGEYNKTIINGENVNWIFNFGQYTQTILKNLTFENVTSTGAVTANEIFNIDGCIFNNCGRGVYGPNYAGGVIKDSIFDNAPSTIYGNSEGSIKISNCSFSNCPSTALIGTNFNVTDSKFINNYNSANNGAAINAQGSLISTNNEFTNNTGGAIYFYNGETLYSANDTFKDNKGVNGGAIHVRGNLTCVNGTFINNSASSYGGAIYSYSSTSERHNVTVENTTTTNNTAVINGKDIYLDYSTSPGVNLVFVGNGTVNINKLTGTVTATVTDDEGNSISGGYVSFYLNGNYIGQADVVNGLATLTYVGFKNGTYTLTGTYSNSVDPVYTKNGVVKVAITEEPSVEYYVSKSGSDDTGDGSKAKPFLTIQKALLAGLEKSRNITIHLLEGVYSGVGNVNVTLPGTMNITILGEGVNKTVIDGESTTNWIFDITLGDGLITLDGLSIINSRSTTLSPIMIANTTVKILNSYFNNNTGLNGGAINNQGNLTINNTTFDANTAATVAYGNYGGGAIFNTGTLTIDNALFKNNKATTGTAILNTGNLSVSNSSIKDNTKTTMINLGNAIHGAEGSSNSIINCIFTNNVHRSINYDVYANNAFLEIRNSTFCNSTGVFVGSGSYTVYNSYFTGISKAITLQGGNLTVMGCLFENNTYSLYGTGDNLNISNCVIFNPVQITDSSTNVTANYNWWGSNDRPVITGLDNLILDYWLVMTLRSDDKPGLSKNIVLAFKSTDGENVYAFEGYLPVREYLFSVSNGTINPLTGNLTDNVVNTVFNAGDYGNYTVSATIDNQTIAYVFELFQANSTTTVNLSNSTGKLGNKVVITAEVKDENGDPVDGGEVEFFIGTTSIGKVQVVDGKAVKEWIVDRDIGEYEINVQYLGSDAYRVSDNYAAFTVQPDTVAPVVKADVKGGSYNITKKVTLTVTDDNDPNPQIYYTIDGTTPTIKSALYNGPISISKTTILKFIAVDSAGNVSPVQTEVYTIDTAKPSITSIDPANGATKISASKTIKIIFSEAIKAGSKFWVELLNSSKKAVSFTSSISGKVLTITPTSNLAESLYSLIIHTGAVTDLAGNPVALTTSKFSVGASPTVTSTDPKNNAGNVGIGKIIEVTFNENIKKGGKFWVELLNSSKKAVSFTSSISGKVLTIDPKSNLAESLYTLCIHTGAVIDLAGNPVAVKSTKFSVGKAPTVSKVDPKNGATKIASGKIIKVTFNENIKKGSNWFELKNSSGKAVSFTSSISGKVLTIKPKSKLAESLYTLCIHTGAVTDLAGNPVAVKTTKFSVGAPPTVTKSDPKNSAINVARNKVVKVTFNENIKAGKNYWIELIASNGTKMTVKKSVKGKVLTITPTKTLKTNTKYKLVLHTGTVTDLVGNPVALKTLTFTTRKT